MKRFEFLSDLAGTTYEDEINQYVNKSMDEEGGYQNEEGEWLGKNSIDCWDEAFQFFGYEWVGEQMKAGRIKKEVEEYIILF